MINVPVTKRPLKTRGMGATPTMWIKDKAQYDSNLWGSSKKYWIIDNNMYDLSNFAQKHPGGSNWIKLTQGHDISQHFQVHHLNQEKAKQVLDKYYVGECPNKQQPRYTFEEEGLFKTVKRRMLKKYSAEQLSNCKVSEKRANTLLIFWLILMFLTGFFSSYLLAVLTGFLTMALNGVAHNFVHKRPNLYRHLYILSGFTAKQWEIAHCLSHHIYPNTLLDYEIGIFEPIMKFHRCQTKNHKFAQFSMQIISVLISLGNVISELIVVPIKQKTLPDLQPALTLLQIPFLFILNGSARDSIFLFILIHLSFGFFYGKVVHCTHKVPQVWNEGASQIRQYGLHTAMATAEMDHQAVGYKSLLLYVGFNIHVVHHFFPTIDHEHLKKVDDIFREVCKERGIRLIQTQLIECNKKMSKIFQGERVPFILRVDN